MAYIRNEIADRFKHGHLLVGVTQVEINPDITWKPFKGFLLRCPTENDAPIWVGSDGVTADSNITTGGFPILPGATLELPLGIEQKLYAISIIVDQDLAWILA